MKLEDIIKTWETDCKVDSDALDDESIRTAHLHQKYYKIYIHEKLQLRVYQGDLKVLKNDIWEFYTAAGKTAKSVEKGWVLPPDTKGDKVLKSEAGHKIDVHPEVIEMNLKIGLQEEKIDYLEEIIQLIKDRRWDIRNAIEFKKLRFAGSN